jgi:hypothetical protein
MQLISFVFPRTAGHEFDIYVSFIQDMLTSSNHISSISFDATYLNKWHARMDYEPPGTFSELTELTFKLRPGIFIDRTTGHKFKGEEKELLEEIEKISQWLKKHTCPKLKTLKLQWAETSSVTVKFYTGYNDGYDSDGPIRETDYHYNEEPLDGNLLVHTFMNEFHLDFSWLPESVKNLVLPGILYDYSTGPEGVDIEVDTFENYYPEYEQFDSIIKGYI